MTTRPKTVLVVGATGSIGRHVVAHLRSRNYRHHLVSDSVHHAWNCPPKRVDLIGRIGAVRKAFDLTSEPAAIRERYGRSTYGQACLLARRLVEAGARFVNVYFAPFIGGDTGGWDTPGLNQKPM